MTPMGWTLAAMGSLLLMVAVGSAMVAVGSAVGRLLRRRRRALPKHITPDQVEHDDPMVRELIARVWNSGKSMEASRDEDGNVTMRELD